MYLLDTNIISMLDPKRQHYSPDVVKWLRNNDDTLFLSVMTITEMEAGRLKLLRDNKTERAQGIDALIKGIISQFQNRILPIDLQTSHHIAQLSHSIYQNPIALPDLIIAATALRYDLVLLTRNLKYFARLDIKIQDPFDSLPD
jgi:toxin FitB